MGEQSFIGVPTYNGKRVGTVIAAWIEATPDRRLYAQMEVGGLVLEEELGDIGIFR